MKRVRSKVTRGGGLEAFSSALEGTDHIRTAVNNAANNVRTVARRLLNDSGAKSGEFRSRKGGGQYVASAAGEVPAQFTGHLARHLSVRRAKKQGSGTRAVAWAGSTSPHAHLLEYGTVAMRARPYMGPAARIAKEQNYRNIKAAAKTSVKQAARAALAKLRARPG